MNCNVRHGGEVPQYQIDEAARGDGFLGAILCLALELEARRVVGVDSADRAGHSPGGVNQLQILRAAPIAHLPYSGVLKCPAKFADSHLWLLFGVHLDSNHVSSFSL